MSTDTSDLPSSKLGTKSHWDDVYANELSNFEEIGDEGEIWFGEDSIEKMVEWVQDYIPISPTPSILEIGSGNGTLLFAISQAGYDPTHIFGVDYSEDAIKLSRSIGVTRGEGSELIRFEVCDFLQDVPRGEDGQEEWDLVLDKGTFDAMALAEKDEHGRSPADGYPSRVGKVVKREGFFLIVSCNFTEDELKEKFANSETGLEYHSNIKFPSFAFGGHSGNVYSSIALRKP
ncbi:Protein-lysine N-methyltransferase EFM4 [Abortiporus biennis]